MLRIQSLSYSCDFNTASSEYSFAHIVGRLGDRKMKSSFRCYIKHQWKAVLPQPPSGARCLMLRETNKLWVLSRCGQKSGHQGSWGKTKLECYSWQDFAQGRKERKNSSKYRRHRVNICATVVRASSIGIPSLVCLILLSGHILCQGRDP
jgi:hypothetical protein